MLYTAGVRLFWVLLSSSLCAGLVLASGALLLWLTPEASGADQPSLRQALESDAQHTRQLIQLVCQRDRQLERLLIELSAGASETDAARQSETLQRLLGGRVQLLAERAGKLTLLSSPTDSEPPTLALLERAARTRVVSERSPATALDSCLATRGTTRLWLARSHTLAALLRAFRLESAQLARSEGPPSAGAVAWASLPDGGTLSVRAPRVERADGRWFVALAVLSALALLLGALLGLWLTRAQPVDEAVLSAIESATTRVAQGDLSSQIGLRVGGRADQTLRSFDRMTHELRETRAKLREAERAAAWQDMAQRIAHEIKNPLSPIKMALETMRKAHAQRLGGFESRSGASALLFDEIFEESTRAMLEEVARMEHILREFSDFARLPKARPGALELSQLVEETVGLYAPHAVALELSLAGPLHIHADREQLVQVIVNLLANAGDAALAASQPRVLVRVARAEGKALLSVEDNGPGVPDSEHERIFEPYVTSKAHGTGLGLSIVRRIVLDHQGSIEVDRGTLGGARFTVSLPERSGAESTMR